MKCVTEIIRSRISLRPNVNIREEDATGHLEIQKIKRCKNKALT